MAIGRIERIENMCPLFMIGYFAGGGGLPISDMYCIGKGCQLWDKENEVCSVKSISQELSRIREQLGKIPVEDIAGYEKNMKDV